MGAVVDHAVDDRAADAAVGGELVSYAELARRLGVTKQAIQKRARKLIAAGKLRAVRRGREVLVDPAEYARAVREHGDPARELASDDAPAAVASTTTAKTFRDARTERELVELELKRLQLQEREGRLRPVEEIEAAALDAGQAIAKRLDQLPTHADRLTATAHKKGAEGVKEYLIELARDLREGVAADLSTMLGGADAAEQPADD